MARDMNDRLWTVVIDFAPLPDTLSAYYSDDDGATWVFDAVVALQNAVIHSPSLAVDKYNNVHVAWCDQGYGANPLWSNIQYRRRVGGVWQAIEHVTDAAQHIVFAALAVDSVGNPYVAYPDWSGAARDIFLARRPWVSENVSNNLATADIWQVCSIAIDQTDIIHLTWDMRDLGPGPWWLHIRYTQGTPGAWIPPEQVDTQPLDTETQYHSCIAVDLNNDVHVVWLGHGWGVNPIRYNVRYRKRESGVWQAEEAITDKAIDQHDPSVSLERATGNIWVAYWDNTVQQVVRQRTGAGWQPEVTFINGEALNLIWAVNPPSNMPLTGCGGVYLFSPAPGQSRYYGPGLGPAWLKAPAVTTEAANNIETTAAILNGYLPDDGGLACDCGLEWGLTVAYGYTTPIQSRITGEVISHRISGLQHDTLYHFRAFATNLKGTIYGADMTFVTESPALAAGSFIPPVLLNTALE